MRTGGPSRLKGMPGKDMAKGGMKGMGDKPDIADVPFESALFNGLGRFPGTRAPLANLRVKPGETLRLRRIKRHRQRPGPQPPGPALAGQQPGPLVLPLPH